MIERFPASFLHTGARAFQRITENNVNLGAVYIATGLTLVGIIGTALIVMWAQDRDPNLPKRNPPKSRRQ